MTISDVNKIRNEISTLSHYARMPRKATSTAPGDDYFHLPSPIFVYSSIIIFANFIFYLKCSRANRRDWPDERLPAKESPRNAIPNASWYTFFN